MAEPGRALNDGDVSDVAGEDVARAVDSGILATRHRNRREFRKLGRWLAGQPNPVPESVAALETPCTKPARNEWHRIAQCALRTERRRRTARRIVGIVVAYRAPRTPSRSVLSIGKLSPGAGEYYVGEIATSVEDYYTGRGEAQGRWVGSLRDVLGVDGPVDSDHFRRVLRGDHPFTGEHLVSSRGLAGRAAARRAPVRPTEMSDEVGSARAAALLGVSHQHVRRLLKAGAEYRTALAQAGPEERVLEPRRYLLGERRTSSGATGSGAWRITRTEVERLAAERTQRKPRPGHDVTLRPPKSVSVLWALARPEVRAEIRQAHTEAVEEVVRYLEDRAVRGRIRDKGPQLEVETDGVIAAAFDHRTSRAGDPLLHTHVVVANMTRLEGKDGLAWRAIAGYGLFEHAKAAGHLYQAHLRHLLTARLGVAWGPTTNGYADIVGVPAAVIEAFSKRRTEIAEVLAESGNTSARAAQIATLETRKPKHYNVDPDSLFDLWRTEAESVGFSPEKAARCLHKTTTDRLAPAKIAAVFDDLAGPAGVTERASTFSRSDVIEALASHVGAACPAAQIEILADQFLASDACVVVDRTTSIVGTTASRVHPVDLHHEGSGGDRDRTPLLGGRHRHTANRPARRGHSRRRGRRAAGAVGGAGSDGADRLRACLAGGASVGPSRCGQDLRHRSRRRGSRRRRRSDRRLRRVRHRGRRARTRGRVRAQHDRRRPPWRSC